MSLYDPSTWLDDIGSWFGAAGIGDVPTEASESYFNLGGNVPDSLSLGDEYSIGNVLGSAANNAANDSNWYDSFLSPSVLGAAITAGGGLIANLNSLDMQKEALSAQQEEQKMNQLLELAKLKYQLLGKGASTSSGRGSRGGGGNSNAALGAQMSANLASGYQNLGNNLSSIYRS